MILPVPIKGTFTYKIPHEYLSELVSGCRVIVQFGKRKIYTGIVHHVHTNRPEEYEPKEILDLIDASPVFASFQIAYFQWIANYYMCTIGEVVNAALPSGLKISSESYISLNPDIDLDDLELTEKEQMVINNLSTSDMTLDDLSNLLEIKTTHHHVRNLVAKKAIHLFEKVKDKYQPKTERRVRINPALIKEDSIQSLFDALEKKPKQIDLLLFYLKETGTLDQPGKNETGISKSILQKNGSASSLATLIKNNVFEEWKERVSRIPFDDHSPNHIPTLSPEQEEAKANIFASFEKKDTVLLRGITGSGKTEVYISIIENVINDGGTVLYLLPEIALTTQIIKRLRRVFGDSFGIYHSRYSENERVEVWQKVLTGEYKFVVGVRSAVFLPFNELSLIIVDEEHETSYKQHDPAPRYHARDTAIYLAALHHAKVLLGSATPALETYKNALDQKYGLVTLESRYGNVALPDIAFADLKDERKRRKLKGNFSSLLLHEIQNMLDQNKQVILFQNRRGYAPYLECNNCGFLAKCPNCDVSLTYHIYQNVLKCHYCGHKKEMIDTCPQCQSNELRTMSFGTEKLEEELEILLPTARIQRMDLDSTRSKYGYQRIIDDFEAGEIDILVGTQMVSKGLDFDKVELVGVFGADRMINFPDFRSHERAYQMIHQVSGRSGRKNQGKVVIQTNEPNQAVLQLVKRHDYLSFYQGEILEREKFRYPPFYRMIGIMLKDMDKQLVFDASQFLYKELSRQLGTMRVIGPVEPIVGRIRNQYLMEITIKVEKHTTNLTALKEFLLTSRNILLSQRSYKRVKVQFDVDPI